MAWEIGTEGGEQRVGQGVLEVSFTCSYIHTSQEFVDKCTLFATSGTADTTEKDKDPSKESVSSSGVRGSVEQYLSRVLDAKGKGLVIGALVTPKQKSKDAEAPTAWYIRNMTEETCKVESATLGKTVVNKEVSMKELVLHWKLSSEKVPVMVSGYSSCHSTDQWKWIAVKSKVL